MQTVLEKPDETARARQAFDAVSSCNDQQGALGVRCAVSRQIEGQRLPGGTLMIGQQIALRRCRSASRRRSKALARGCIVGAEVLGNGHWGPPLASRAGG